MLKVNEERLLCDHKELVEKKQRKLASVESDARAYAGQRGYDEDKTQQFIAFLQGIEGDGLSTEEQFKLQLLASYIEDIEEPAQEEVAETTSVDDLNAQGTTVNII